MSRAYMFSVQLGVCIFDMYYFQNLPNLTFSVNFELYICCGSILSVVPILFPLFQTHYHQITITKTKEIKFEPRIKLNHNIYTV